MLTIKEHRFPFLEKVNDWNGSLTKSCKDKSFKSLWDKQLMIN